MFSLTFKAFVMFVTFSLFQSNLYIVLACGKGHKNSVHRDLFKILVNTLIIYNNRNIEIFKH